MDSDEVSSLLMDMDIDTDSPSPSPISDIIIDSHPPTLQSSSSSRSLVVYRSHDAPLRGVQDMIRDAFEGTEVDDSFTGLIQFWAPVTTSGRHLLITYDQPFSLPNPDLEYFYQLSWEYRESSVRYQYNVRTNDLQAGDCPAIVSDGAPVGAFRSKVPQFSTGCRIPNKSLWYSFSWDFGWMNSMMLPVFYPSEGECVGVVECCTRSPEELLRVFRKLSTALGQQGLKMYDPQGYLPYNTVPGLQLAKDAIHNAIDIIRDTYQIPLVQVWIAYKVPVTYSSSSEHMQITRMMWFKLTDAWKTDDIGGFSLFKEYGYLCYKIPLVMGSPGEIYEPHFIQNIMNSSVERPDELSSIWFNCSCFMIYLTSTETPGLDYVFEFLWEERERHAAILESLLGRLQTDLPNFEFAYGTKLGDKIDILDVNRSAVNDRKYFPICGMPLQREIQPRVEESTMLLRARGNTA